MRKLMLVCATLVVIAAVVSVNLWRELRVARELAATPQPQLAPAVERLPDPTPTVQPATLPPQPGTGGQPVVPPALSGSAMPDIDQMLAESAALARDPEYRKASAARMRMNIPQDYPGLVEELGLT